MILLKHTHILMPVDKDFLTAGILILLIMSFIISLPNGQNNPLPEGSPMQESGIQYGDRIAWVDGVPIYSNQQLVTCS